MPSLADLHDAVYNIMIIPFIVIFLIIAWFMNVKKGQQKWTKRF